METVLKNHTTIYSFNGGYPVTVDCIRLDAEVQHFTAIHIVVAR